MKKQLLLTLTFVVIVATPAFAQLASPNSSGVAAGHIHLNANDVEVQKKFWTDVGGKIVNREKLVMVQFPGIYVLLRKQDYNGGSVGSVINHFGLYVKDFDQAVARWKAAGLNWEPGNNPGQGYLNGPDSVRSTDRIHHRSLGHGDRDHGRPGSEDLRISNPKSEMSDWTALKTVQFRISGLSLIPPVRTEVL